MRLFDDKLKLTINHLVAVGIQKDRFLEEVMEDLNDSIIVVTDLNVLKRIIN